MEPLTPLKGITDIGGKRFVWGERTYVMGVINVTPDSFSNDGVDSDVGRGGTSGGAVSGGRRGYHRRGRRVDAPAGNIWRLEAGIGRTRNWDRVLPMIEAITRETDLPVSIDTYKAASRKVRD